MRPFAILLAVVLAFPLGAADRQRIAALNVGGTALLTYLGCVVHGKLHRNRASTGRCLAAGTIAGAGFYQAKRLAGDGEIATAWIVANAATSIAENTVANEHPLSRIGYTIGPFRFRVATPFDRERESFVDVDLSLAETGYLIRTVLDADDVDIRDGLVWYETNDFARDDQYLYLGYTWGIYPGVWSGARDATWRHEAVHAVQALQLESVEPAAFLVTRGRRPVRFRSVHAGALNVFDNVTWAQVPYENRWVEIEAFRLAEDRDPPK